MQSEQSGNQAKFLPSQTDAELFLALKAGQTDALGILYNRHAELVFGLAMRTLGNPQEAEDLTQDVFLTLAKGCSYDPRRGSLRTFLAILTRSRSIDRMRSRNVALENLGRWRPSSSEALSSNAPMEHVSQGEQSQEVQAALAQLSNDEQQVLRMAYYDGLTQSAIAERLEIPLGTVKARARRGLLKLRHTLADFIEE